VGGGPASRPSQPTFSAIKRHWNCAAHPHCECGMSSGNLYLAYNERKKKKNLWLSALIILTHIYIYIYIYIYISGQRGATFERTQC